MIYFLRRLLNAFRPKHVPSNKHVSICVGHSRIGDSGAVSVGGVNEWVYNKAVASSLREELVARGYDATVFNHYPKKGYTSAIRWLADEIRDRHSACCVELHFNSSSRQAARGFEYLFLDGSHNGKDLAECLHAAHKEHFTKQEDRGIKGVVRGGRGHGFLRLTPAPAVICEPFFGSNVGEWNAFANNERELAVIYADGIEKFLNL